MLTTDPIDQGYEDAEGADGILEPFDDNAYDREFHMGEDEDGAEQLHEVDGAYCLECGADLSSGHYLICSQTEK